jgi:pyruvate dehydrogenase E1 component alpha subunit/2-oxoisovalerate dehydrogenase E1 component alpha subunit
MVQTMLDPGAATDSISARDAFLKAFRIMLLSRTLDEKFASIYRSGKIHGGVFLGRGQEALSVSAGIALREGDVFAPAIRDLAGRLAFGEKVLDAARTYLGSSLGPMRGRDGNIHRGRPREGLLAMISHLGAMISTTNGMLFARRMRGVKGTVGVACLGEGGTSTGSCHEALNQAGIEKLPLVMVIANNQYAYSTPNSRQFACESLVQRAVGYGFTGHEVDGTDLRACLSVVGGAIAAAREGRGPQLIVAKLLRLCGHGEHDPADYIEARAKAAPSGQDCIKLAEQTILSHGWGGQAEIAQWQQEASQKVEDAINAAQREPAPDPFTEKWSALSTDKLLEGNHVYDGGPANI